MPYYMSTKIMDFFLQVLNMSFTASFVIVAVLIARLLLKKTPKIFSYALWSVVLFRLLCPISFESMLSLLPVNTNPISTNTLYSAAPQIDTGLPYLDAVINPALPVPEVGTSVNPLQIMAVIGEFIWLVGIAALLFYSVVSLLRLRRKLIGSVRLRDNIYLSDHIASPFVIGIAHPKIYLPSTLSDREQGYIILHEQTHIRRLDYLVKIVAFAALCIHWFNPLVWAAFLLAVKDMEMSCDESVMMRLHTDIREEYSASLLRLATGRKMIAGTPLAFGEGDTKNRIKNVMHYKKPMFWVIFMALAAVAAVVVVFALNPRRATMQWAKNLRVEDIQKIELIAEPSAENERYRLFTIAEFQDVVDLVNESHGKYLPNPEPLSGGYTALYITTTDGIRHTFVNSGNSYLVIDGESYDSGYDWLSSWEYQEGNAFLPATFAFHNGPLLTIDELKTIAQKGDAISWEDFSAYEVREIGSGLYIMLYPMTEPYYVTVGGIPEETPRYVRLCSTETEQYIDIREESIDQFLQNAGIKRGLSDLRPMLMIDGYLYLDTGKESPMEAASTADGKIQSSVPQNERPTENGQSNFGAIGSNYVMSDGFVQVNLMDKWIIFEPESLPLTFAAQSDAIAIGEEAVRCWLDSKVGVQIPETERIGNYTVSRITVTDSEPKAGEIGENMPYDYVVQANYSITTDSEAYHMPGDGVSGKGTFDGLYCEIYVRALDNGDYEIVSVSRGRNEQELLEP